VNSGADAGFLPLWQAELKISTFYYLIMFFGPSRILKEPQTWQDGYSEHTVDIA